MSRLDVYRHGQFSKGIMNDILKKVLGMLIFWNHDVTQSLTIFEHFLGLDNSTLSWCGVGVTLLCKGIIMNV